MKKLFLIALLLTGCEGRISKEIGIDSTGHVQINGKDCEMMLIATGDYRGQVVFIDCGPGSSSINYPMGKVRQNVGQYVPPIVSTSNVVDAGAAESTCYCSCR